jgi:5-formyltetrahydrofolate cyclo-ligase
MSTLTSRKQALREQLLLQRKQLPPRERETAATAAARNVHELPRWRAARRVAIYLPANAELDTGPLAGHCREQDKALYLPVIRDDDSLEFALWRENARLVNNRFGIAEPGRHAPRLVAGDIDIIFLPLVGWDKTGNRLGMGGGFYDRTLAGIAGPIKVGLAYNCQRADRIPADPWDITLDFVVTEDALYRCKAGAAGSAISPG